MNDALNKIVGAVKAAGGLIANVHGNVATKEKGSPSNLVTEYDGAVQSFLMARLGELFPNARFMGEEEETPRFFGVGEEFIIDPIDGTTNFARGLGMSAVSVAFAVDGTVVCGAVYNPYREEMYTALRGGGAYLNGTPIGISSLSLEEGLVLFGSAPYDWSLREDTLAVLRNVFAQASDIRRLGAASLDICHVAAGRAEGFFEVLLHPWDYAAAALILQEAGGRITNRVGAPLPYNGTSFVVAGTERCFAQLLELMQV